MTQNQIAYWRLQEEQRANRAKENLSADENISKRISAEASSSQARTAAINASTKQKEQEEAARHNRKQEELSATQIAVKGATDTFGSIVKIFK